MKISYEKIAHSAIPILFAIDTSSINKSKYKEAIRTALNIIISELDVNSIDLSHIVGILGFSDNCTWITRQMGSFKGEKCNIEFNGISNPQCLIDFLNNIEDFSSLYQERNILTQDNDLFISKPILIFISANDSSPSDAFLTSLKELKSKAWFAEAFKLVITPKSKNKETIWDAVLDYPCAKIQVSYPLKLVRSMLVLSFLSKKLLEFQRMPGSETVEEIIDYYAKAIPFVFYDENMLGICMHQFTIDEALIDEELEEKLFANFQEDDETWS